MEIDSPARLPEQEGGRQRSFSPMSPIPSNISADGLTQANSPPPIVHPSPTKREFGLDVPFVDLTMSSGAPTPVNTPPPPEHPPQLSPALLLAHNNEPPATPVVIPPTPLGPQPASPVVASALPASDATASGPPPDQPVTDEPSVNVLVPKPKKQKKPRAPSPTLAPPPPPPPLPTVRLEIPLQGGNNYAVNVLELAKTTGQRNPTPPPIVHSDYESSESEKEEAPKKGLGVGKGKKGGKREKKSREYDLDDPFIDDSELMVDEPKYMARTKQDGFYVSSGPVALFNPSKKKAAKPKVNFTSRASSHALAPPPSSTSSGSVGPGIPPITTPSKDPSMHSSSSLMDITMGDADSEDVKPVIAGKKRALDKGAVLAGGIMITSEEDSPVHKKRKTLVAVEPFSPELEQMLNDLRDAVSQESFEVKSKFPPGLKPMLERVSLFALQNGEYGDNYFNVMPKIFPYNRFTMMKLIKRMIFFEHQKLLTAKTDVLLADLKALADSMFPEAEADYETKMRQYEEHMAAKAALGTSTSAPAVVTQAAGEAPGATPTPDPEAAKEKEQGKEKEEKAPQKKFRWNEQMRNILWDLVVISNESAQLTNEKTAFDGGTSNVSEQGMRKDLYKKIVGCFPDGWMQSTIISREVSALKKKNVKEEQDMIED